MSTPSQYDVFQQVFGLSLASNLIRECTGTATDLQNRFKQALPAALEAVGVGWKVVWGPVVWKATADTDPSTTQDNAWFVAKNDQVDFGDGVLRSAYIVAIAGTSSNYSWIIQDLKIYRVVDLDSWAGSGPESLKQEPPSIPNNASVPLNIALISEGFAGAVFRLINTSPLPGFPGYGQTLPEFLLNLRMTPTSQPAPKLIFTGHSLGGALSPALAYTLYKANALGSFTLGDVCVYPTAAPTVGNAWFAKKFKDYFPSPSGTLQGYRCWNCNIVCRLDIVPCGFCVDASYHPLNLDKALTMYGNTCPGAVSVAVLGLKLLAKRLFYPITASFFDSKFPKPPNPIEDFNDWMNEAHQQHTAPYAWEILNRDVPPGLCHTSKENEWGSYPVLGTIADVADKIPANDNIKAEDVADRLLDRQASVVVA